MSLKPIPIYALEEVEDRTIFPISSIRTANLSVINPKNPSRVTGHPLAGSKPSIDDDAFINPTIPSLLDRGLHESMDLAPVSLVWALRDVATPFGKFK